jgi:hypothetical protein
MSTGLGCSIQGLKKNSHSVAQKASVDVVASAVNQLTLNTSNKLAGTHLIS